MDLKGTCSFHVRQSSQYWFPGTDEVQAKKSQRLSSKVNARQKNMSLVDEIMMEILR